MDPALGRVSPFYQRLGARVAVAVFWMAVGGLAVHVADRQRLSTKDRFVSIASMSLREDGSDLRVTAPERLESVPVLNVVDGDTVEVLRGGTPVFLRYYGVNTTERGHPCYNEATTRNRVLAGGVLRLAFDERRQDKYGRLLAYVFTEEGRSIDALLVAEGWGRAWRRDGLLKDRLTALENQARAAKTGCLWSGETPATSAGPRRKKRART